MPQIKMNKSHWLLILGTIAIFIVLFLLGWFPRMINNERIDAIAADHSIPQVVVMKVKANTKPIELILPSSASAWHTTPIWARTNGYLIRYLVDIGDAVKEGELLAEIDTPEVDQELAQAEAELANSKAQQEIARITTNRWQDLWNKNRQAVSKQEVDQYSSNNKAAEATVLANEKNVARLRYLQQYKKIYAPFEGIITQRNIDIGSLIYGNVNGVPQELFQIAQTHIIRFFVQVPQNYFRQIKDGLETIVTVKEFPGKNFKGMVTRFAKALDPTARTLLTEVDVSNDEGVLYPGIYANINFMMYPETMNFIIPTTSVIIRSGYPHAAVLDENNIVHLQKVQIGRDYGKEMEITNGLKENDVIITLPSDQIHQGAKVTILN